MVCVPCIVIPVLLWVFHKFIQPFIMKFWNPWGSKSVEGGTTDFTEAVLSSSEGKFIKERVDNNSVILFSKTTCNFCKMAKKTLDNISVSYHVEEIDGREDMKALQDVFEKVTGARTVPRVFIGGKCVGGASEMMTLHNQNKLIPMMKEAGAAFKEKAA